MIINQLLYWCCIYVTLTLTALVHVFATIWALIVSVNLDPRSAVPAPKTMTHTSGPVGAFGAYRDSQKNSMPHIVPSSCASSISLIRFTLFLNKNSKSFCIIFDPKTEEHIKTIKNRCLPHFSRQVLIN